MKKKIFFLLKILVSLSLIFWLVFKKVDWKEVKFYFQDIQLIYIFLYIFLYILGIIISARKWQILAQAKDFRHYLKFYVEVYLIGAFINNFLPSFIGGDSYRTFRLGEKAKNFKTSSCTVIVDRLSGLLATMIFAILFAFLNFPLFLNNRTLGILFLSLVLAFLGFVFLIFSIKWKRDFFKTYFSQFLPKKVLAYLLDFASFKKWEVIFGFMSYSFLFNFVGIALANFVVFKALNVEISILHYLSLVFLINILASIPITVGNIGVKEWAYITFFGFYGLSSSALISVVFVARILQMLVNFFALPLYLKSKKIENLES